MATSHFPDISHYQHGLDLRGAPAVMAKATQGTSFVDPDYAGFKAQAARLGVPFGAYHWLDTTDAAAQARHCYSVVGGGVPLMIDDEQGAINVAHTLAFVSAYRALGGLVTREYAPRWLWERSGKPDLRPLAAAGLGLVSSSYPSAGYTETGPGWAAYGGVTPVIWQWTSTHAFNGQSVDFNAYRGDINGVFGAGPGPAQPAQLGPQEDDVLYLLNILVSGTNPPQQLNKNGLTRGVGDFHHIQKLDALNWVRANVGAKDLGDMWDWEAYDRFGIGGIGDPAELEQIKQAAGAGVAAAVPAIVDALVAKLPADAMSRADVEAAVRHALAGTKVTATLDTAS